MSHEIRTPLNNINGMLELLKQRKDLENDQCVNNALISSRHLTCLLNDILDISALNAGRISLNEGLLIMGDLDENLRSIIQPLADKKQIFLTMNTNTTVFPNSICDVDKLTQILVNLLSNAVKFTPNKGNVLFLTTIKETHENSVYVDFTVKDNGIGIADSVLPQIFEPFKQEDITGNMLGTGLGLAIAKKLTELMNGTITIQSELNKGTSITVSLILCLAAKNEIRRGPKNTQTYKKPNDINLSGKHALIVEDNKLNMEVMEHLLKSYDFIIDKVENGLDAIQAFENSYHEYYDVIFMDVVMPKCDGLNATRTIRLMDRADAKRIPIIAMTANAFPDDIQKSFEYGMTYHLSKPLNPKELKSILINQFGK